MPWPVNIGNILSISSGEAFEKAALELFAFQARECAAYREYIGLAGVDPAKVTTLREIPFLPVEIFKHRKVYCGPGEPDIVFTSSTTGGGEPSRHYMADRKDYERVFKAGFELFYGPAREISVYALLPSYLEREGSSLVYMADKLIEASALGNNGVSGPGGGFYLYDHEKLLSDMAADSRPKLLLGVTYALLDLAGKVEEKGCGFPPDIIIMETGGMKGRRREMPKKELHSVLCEAFGAGKIHSEYGMAELSSQAYSAGDGIFRTPPWMRVVARDLNDPFEMLGAGKTGGLNIIDLANIYSCAFIQTQDVGTVTAEGSFTVSGRADRSEIRGCNLLVQ